LAGKRKRGSRFAAFTGCVSFARQSSLRWAGLHSRSAWKNSSLALFFFDCFGLVAAALEPIGAKGCRFLLASGFPSSLVIRTQVSQNVKML
ncbi:hypothetical protein ABER36_20515, partial [Brevibacillus centrosporus]|uniref:hypothetical protein n=1 Tax=Brevibacillus centrosporus TaxID=54910 RepID=UPI003D218F72